MDSTETIAAPTASPSPLPTILADSSLLSFTSALGDLAMHDSRISLFNPRIGEIRHPEVFEQFIPYGQSGIQLSWSPNGRYLAFDGANEQLPCSQDGCPGLNLNLFLADLGRGTAVGIAPEGSTYSPRFGGAAWSPDSAYLIAPFRVKGDPEGVNLWIFDMESDTWSRLTQGDQADLHPSWSPDGRWIAFLRYTAEKPGCPSMPRDQNGCNQGNLLLTTQDGSGETVLLESIRISVPVPGLAANYNAPVWSSDSRMLLTTVGANDSDIALVDVEDGSVETLAQNSAMELNPSWSPDGQRIVFESNRFDQYDLYVLDLVDRVPLQLTKDDADEILARWSHDGRYLAYLTNREDPGSEHYQLALLELSNLQVNLVPAPDFILGRASWVRPYQPLSPD